MESNNSAWLTEGISPGKPAGDPEWEKQRHKLFEIIHKFIDAGCSLPEVKEGALAWNKNQVKPFPDWDVISMCNWGWRKWAHGQSSTTE
jgi:hypothetical protein